MSRLKSNVKGETVEVLSAKLMNLQQRNKTVSQYTLEVKQIKKALEGAYVEIIRVTFVVVIIITTTMVPNTIMDEANIEVTQEAVGTGVESTTIITQVKANQRRKLKVSASAFA